MDFLFAKNEPFNIASIQQEEGWEEMELLHVVEKMDQEHTKMNATMMNKGGGYKQKDHDMIMNKRNEEEKWSYYMITPKSQQT
jgi:hypothetical protein